MFISNHMIPITYDTITSGGFTKTQHMQPMQRMSVRLKGVIWRPYILLKSKVSLCKRSIHQRNSGLDYLNMTMCGSGRMSPLLTLMTGSLVNLMGNPTLSCTLMMGNGGIMITVITTIIFARLLSKS